VYAAIPTPARKAIASVIGSLPASHRYQSLDWKLKRFVNRWDPKRATRHQRWMSSTDLPGLAAIMAVPHEGPLHGDAMNSLEAVMEFDFTTYLSGSVLTKVDRASMSHGLEVRPPFLDNAVIDYALRLPADVKIRGRTTKWPLKRVAERWLPHEIVHRKKHGFSVPLARWIAGPLRDHASAAIAETAPWINQSVASRLLAEHLAKSQDHSKTLWSLIVLANWRQRLAHCGVDHSTYHSNDALIDC